MTDLNTLAMPTKWTLEDALVLIRALQPQCRQFSFHLALGGGVLNNGFSEKDLDLYFLPMGGVKPADQAGLSAWLEGVWGGPKPLGENYPEEPPYVYKAQFKYGQQRIDVFVLGGESPEKARDAGIDFWRNQTLTGPGTADEAREDQRPDTVPPPRAIRWDEVVVPPEWTTEIRPATTQPRFTQQFIARRRVITPIPGRAPWQPEPDGPDDDPR